MFRLSDGLYKSLTLLLLIFIFTFLLIYYKPFVHKIYESEGYNYSFSLFNLYISVLILFFSLFSIFYLPVKPSVFATSVVIKLLFLIPCLVFFVEMNTDFRIVFSIFLFDFLFIIISLFNYNFKSVQIKFNQQILILIFLLILLLIPIIFSFGMRLNFELFLLKDIYKTRLAIRNISNPLVDYCIFWSSKVIIPIIIVYGLMFKKNIITLIGIVSLLLVFLISGAHKAILVSLFIILLFFFFNNYYKKIFAFVFSVACLLVIGMFLFEHFSFVTLEDLLVRRTLLDPSLLDVIYFDFFDNNHMYLSHSIFKSFIDNPFDIQPSYVIGAKYFHNSLSNAGNGIISDGFMNFGMFGVIISILLSVLILCYITAAKLNPKFFGLIFIIIYGYSCTGILTNILTGGVFLIILLIQFFLKNRNYSLTAEL